MKIKLFGKNLFEFNKGIAIYSEASLANKESKFLPDFQITSDWGLNSWADTSIVQIPGGPIAVGKANTPKTEDKKKITQLTPKEVYTLKLLNDKTFKLNTDPEYVDKQVETFKDKLKLIKSEEYDMARGVKEVSSVLIRMENRKKYARGIERSELFSDESGDDSSSTERISERFGAGGGDTEENDPRYGSKFEYGVASGQ